MEIIQLILVNLETLWQFNFGYEAWDDQFTLNSYNFMINKKDLKTSTN